MDNLKQATKKSIYENNVSKLDALGTGKGDYEPADVFSAAESVVADFIERVKTNLNSTDMIVTGAIDDLSMEVTDTGINILGNPYLLYQDEGTKGTESSAKAPDSRFRYTTKMPPTQPFYDWISRKNLNLRNEEYMGGKPSPFEEFDEEKAKKKLAWAMAKTVYKEGFKPQPVFSREIPQLIDDLTDVLGAFTQDMITSSIRNQYGEDIFKRKK
jgi:hypothetical protein